VLLDPQVPGLPLQQLPAEQFALLVQLLGHDAVNSQT
jgi:hypothetical protein